MGQPLEAPFHPDLRRQVDDLSFMMHDRQNELDNACAFANHKSAITVRKDKTISKLANDRKKNRRQLDKKQHIITRLRHKVSALEETIHEKDMQLEEQENAGEEIGVNDYAYLSDDEDFMEDEAMEFITDEEDYASINDEEEEVTNSDE